MQCINKEFLNYDVYYYFMYGFFKPKYRMHYFENIAFCSL